MNIQIDFEVFKQLTALRKSEADSYNNVIRRLLGLSDTNEFDDLFAKRPRKGLFGAKNRPVFPDSQDSIAGLLREHIGGVWFNNVHFPEGTKFRATYKGQTFVAEVENGQWIGADGIGRSSPSDAAGAISGTNVNGWRFWHARLPGEIAWKRLDEFNT